MTKHERLLQDVARTHSDKGRIVHVEQENTLRLRSKNGVTIHGQCDVVVSETDSMPGVILMQKQVAHAAKIAPKSSHIWP